MLKFQFENLGDFFFMAGHGPYVWFCYGITLVGLVFLLVSPWLRQRSMLRQIRRRALIDQESLISEKNRR